MGAQGAGGDAEGRPEGPAPWDDRSGPGGGVLEVSFVLRSKGRRGGRGRVSSSGRPAARGRARLGMAKVREAPTSCAPGSGHCGPGAAGRRGWKEPLPAPPAPG